MMQTIEAVIDEKGKIHLLEEVNLRNFQRVLVTILPNQTNNAGSPIDITKLGEILDDDLETGRQEISQLFLNSIERTAKTLEEN
jgi:hypothetical protein